jgi:2-iminobutanoate/2-iminopropanoate deaminase
VNEGAAPPLSTTGACFGVVVSYHDFAGMVSTAEKLVRIQIDVSQQGQGAAEMKAQEIIAEGLAYPPQFGSPTSLAMRAGDFIYVSGMMPWDAERNVVGVGDIKAQTRQTLQNLELTLRGGGAALADIVKINFYLTDIRDKAAVWDVRKEVFRTSRPASTLVEVVHLVDPLALLEVEAVAYVGGGP